MRCRDQKESWLEIVSVCEMWESGKQASFFEMRDATRNRFKFRTRKCASPKFVRETRLFVNARNVDRSTVRESTPE